MRRLYFFPALLASAVLALPVPLLSAQQGALPESVVASWARTSGPRSVLEARANLDVRNVSLDEALRQLQAASGIGVAYSPSLLPEAHRVSCRCEGVSVAEAATVLLKGLPLEFVALAGQLVIRQRRGSMVTPMRAAAPPEPPSSVDARKVSRTGNAPAVRSPAPPQGTIEGRVIDRATAEPLAGTQVHIIGTGLGALANETGAFRISNVPAGEVRVEAQRIGYSTVTRTISLAPGETVFVEMELRQVALGLDEIVVTGTPGGTQRRAIGNVVERLDAEGIQAVAHTHTVEQLLGQRSTSVGLMGQGGEAGGNRGVRVRGMSSIGLANQPLVYVDGLRIDSESRQSQGQRINRTGFNRMNTINPGDIKSIEIIKGPAAATLYGTEASGGVIQILTHRGAPGETSYDVSTTLGTEWLWDPVGRVGTRWYRAPDGTVESFNLYEREKREGLGPVFTYGNVQDYQVSMRGGTDRIRHFLSTSWSRHQGVIDYNTDRRFSGRANVDLVLSESLTLSARLGYVQGATRLSHSRTANNPIFGIIWGNPEGQKRGFLLGAPEDWRTTNVWAEVDRTLLTMEAASTPTEWFSQRLITGFDLNSEHMGELWPRQPEGSSHIFGIAGLGLKVAERSRRTMLTVDYSGTASFNLTDRITSSSSVGFQYYRTTHEKVGGTAENFPVPGITTLTGGAVTTSFEDWLENASVGVYGQQQIGWEGRAFVTVALRADDNSAFGMKFDAAIYPKVSATWVISEEPFWNVGWLEDLRLRGAWGAAGRQPNAFDAARLFRPTVGYGDQPTVVPEAFGNPELKPERAAELEWGFDAAFLDGRLEAAYTRYDRRVSDLIAARALPLSLGFPGTQIVNLGEVKSWGNEFSLDAQIHSGSRVDFRLGAQFTTQDNEILDLGDRDAIASVGVLENRVGFSIADIFLRKVLDAEVDGAGNLLWALCDGGTGRGGREMGGEAVPCAQAPRVHWGSTEPKWLLGLNANATVFDRLQLYARVEGAGGHAQRAGAPQHGARCCSEPAVLRNDPRDNIFEAYRRHEGTVLSLHEVGFARLREVSASYTLPSRWTERFGANRGSVTVGARNLLMLWTHAEGWNIRGEASIRTKQPGGAMMWDPEWRSFDDISLGDIGGNIPPPASVNLSIRLSF